MQPEIIALVLSVASGEVDEEFASGGSVNTERATSSGKCGLTASTEPFAILWPSALAD
jgi:hypothetical protein